VRYTLLVLLIAAIIGGALALFKWRSLYAGMPNLPETSELWSSQREPAIEFVDKTGKTIAIRGPRYGRAVSVDTLPAHVPQAFIAAEDKRFYEHDGADEAAIARAAWSNWRAGETVSGASTITQQLIKNLVLNPRQTMERKAQEIKLAQALETRLSKNEILGLYLNRMYFGAGLFGVGAASEYYFGKPAIDLTIEESALLAALLKAPSKLNLRENLAGAKDRQQYVLSEMRDLGFITPEQAAMASAAEITIIDAPAYDPQLGYVIDTVAERVKTMLPRVPGDLVVTVSIDTELQSKIQAALTEKMLAEGEALKASQFGALILDKDGAVVSMVGGANYSDSEFNRVTQARRQPGSSFKPFVFAAALESGLSPYDVRVDAPLTIGEWKPENYGGGYIGPMTLSEALTRSTNTVAAALAQETGEERVIEIARSTGISSPLEPFPSLALGSQEVTLWEIVRAFGTFQSVGKRLDPHMILSIEDSRGTQLYKHPDFDRENVLTPDIARKMNAMMARSVQSSIGTGTRAKIDGWTVAGKTGTSQDWRDAWFVGYTAAYVGGVWVGNDDDSPMERVTGGGLPADLWSDMMEIAHAGQSPTSLEGAEGSWAISPAAEQRIAFYRDMSQAFGAAAGERRIASTGQ
jgi:penicillin-binding protein 1A